LVRVFLLGGTSNAGKTTCARQLAERFGLECCSVDDVRRKLQAAAPATDPINYFSSCGWLDLSPENSLDHKNDVARQTCADGLAPLLQRVLVGERDVIMEGDDLLPEFAEHWLSEGVAGAVFLIESDPDVVRMRYWGRDQTLCIRQDQTRMNRFIPHYLGWARWLQSEASQRNLIVIDAGGGDVCSDVAAALGLT
jgi:2-phosphoglycerate kinase